MLLVHPIADSYSITDPAGNHLFEDSNCELFFNFLGMDISDVKGLFSNYYNLMLSLQQGTTPDEETPFPCEYPEARKALSGIRTRLRSIHPFLPNNLYSFIIPQMLAGHYVNGLIENGLDIDEDTFTPMLWMLISEAMQPMYRDDFPKYPVSNKYNKEPLLRSFYQVYKRKLAKKERAVPDFDYLEQLQQQMKTCVYWTLDQSSKRFKGMDSATRSRLYRAIFHPDNLGSDITLRMNFSWSKPDTVSALRQYTEFGKGQHTVELFLDEDVRMTWPEAEASAQKTLDENRAELDRLKENAVQFLSVDSDDCALTEDMTSFFSTAQKSARKAKTSVPYITYQVNSLEDLFYVQVQGLLQSQQFVRKCKYCGRYFLTERSNIDYCQRVANQELQTCSEIGPGRRYLEASSKDEALSAYYKAYKRMYARLHRGSMEQDAFDAWREEAKSNLARVRSGEMERDEFIAWLEGC